MARDGDEITQPGTHCIDRNTGSLIWKVNDTISGMIISPLIYNGLVIKGGLNPHARKLSDGSLEWHYVNDTIKYSMYSNPLIVGDAAYFACFFQVIKLTASAGGTVWSTSGWYPNLRSSRLVYNNDRLYYGDSFENRMTSFYESNGQIEWSKPFEKPFANIPFVTGEEIFVGIQDSDIDNKTLRCLYLSDQSEKWAVKLGVIFSDVVVADSRVYAIGMQTLHCRSAADGSAIWLHELSAGAVSEPMVAGNKVVVGYGNGLVCLNAATGELLWEYKTAPGQDGKGFTSPTLDGDRFYVSCTDGNVYCFSID
jgi:outer membrane protein assembly factor BamB